MSHRHRCHNIIHDVRKTQVLPYLTNKGMLFCLGLKRSVALIIIIIIIILSWIEKGCLLVHYLFILSWSEMECQKTLMKGLCLVTHHIDVLHNAYFVNSRNHEFCALIFIHNEKLSQSSSLLTLPHALSTGRVTKTTRLATVSHKLRHYNIIHGITKT